VLYLPQRPIVEALLGELGRRLPGMHSANLGGNADRLLVPLLWRASHSAIQVEGSMGADGQAIEGAGTVR